MRDICTVVRRIIEKIPAHDDRRERLAANLEGLLESSDYTSPEGMYVRWQGLGAILESFLGKPDEDWKLEIQKIVRGEK